MRKIYISLLFSMVLSTSCSDMLVEDPNYIVYGKNLFQRESDAQLALNGCYGYLTGWDAYGQAYWEVQEGASGLFWGQTNNSIQDELASMSVMTNNQLPLMSWRGFYTIISNCNLFLYNLEESPLSDEYKQYAGAQAKFIRALSYYNLVFTYGDVPLKTDPSTSENIYVGRTPKMEVLAQVAQDWKDAVEGLKDSETDSSVPTKSSANAFLAKLYWMMGSAENTPSSEYWAMAKEYGDQAIGAFQLESKPGAIFEQGVQDSRESIFKLNMSQISVKDDQGNRTSWIFSPQNSTEGISWGRYRISKAFYDFFRGTHPTDPRVSNYFMSTWVDKNNKTQYSYPYFIVKSGREEVLDSIIAYSDPTLDCTNPDTLLMTQTAKTRFMTSGGDHQGWSYLRKTYDSKAQAQRSNKHLFLYRYSDLLLLMADVENELGNQAQSLEYLNQVLSRARNAATPAAAHPANVEASASQDELRRIIFRERQFELVGECFSTMDVRRRGEEFFNEFIIERHNNHTITKTHSPAIANANFWDRLFPVDQVKRNMLMPIPQEEINTNSAISSSDQNYGY
ncbi:MAG: RagB/SusD family nutrient uptake outer membrane protein [Bacteroidales bacterium]